MQIEKRPWGSYEVLLDEPTYKVKRITVEPQQQLSLQFHNFREEHWTIVEGGGTIRVGECTFNANVGDRILIPKLAVHRATADSKKLVFIEVQLGKCEEEDITRLEDSYGRSCC